MGWLGFGGSQSEVCWGYSHGYSLLKSSYGSLEVSCGECCLYTKYLSINKIKSTTTFILLVI